MSKANAMIESDSLNILKIFYDNLPKNNIKLELLADDKVIENPSWQDVKRLQGMYKSVTLKYEKD